MLLVRKLVAFSFKADRLRAGQSIREFELTTLFIKRVVFIFIAAKLVALKFFLALAAGWKMRFSEGFLFFFV